MTQREIDKRTGLKGRTRTFMTPVSESKFVRTVEVAVLTALKVSPAAPPVRVSRFAVSSSVCAVGAAVRDVSPRVTEAVLPN